MALFRSIAHRIAQYGIYLAEFFLPWREPKTIEGEEAMERLGPCLKEKGFQKPLLVMGKKLASLHSYDPLVKGFEKAGLAYALYDGAVPDPTFACVEEGAKFYLEQGCDCIVAFGGGSSIDCAKAIGVKVVYPSKSLSRFKGILKVHKKIPYLTAIPTTAGSGSETTLAAVVRDQETGDKFQIDDCKLIPSLAVLDPSLLSSLPPSIIAETGLDALCHAIEAYIGQSNTKKTKEKALIATKLIIENLPKLIENPQNMEAASAMEKGAFYAGVAFTRAGVGYVHALSHSVGGYFHASHGRAISVLLVPVLKAYGHKADRKLAEIALYLGADANLKQENLVAYFFELVTSITETYCKKTFEGIYEGKDIDKMVRHAEKEAFAIYAVPKILTHSELVNILEEVK